MRDDWAAAVRGARHLRARRRADATRPSPSSSATASNPDKVVYNATLSSERVTVDVLVVGAGISGIAAARRCTDAGPARPGARPREADRRPARRARPRDGHPVDLGAPYCTVSDDRFRAVADGWLARGLLREWTDTFRVAGPDGLGEARTGPMRYARARRHAEPRRGPRARASRSSSGSSGRSAGLEVDGGAARVVVLAMPGPQAVRLLPRPPRGARRGGGPAVRRRRSRSSRGSPSGPGPSSTPRSCPTCRSGGSRTTAAATATAPRCSSRTRRPSSRPAHLDDPTRRSSRRSTRCGRCSASRSSRRTAFAHRWTFAQPTAPRDRTFLLDRLRHRPVRRRLEREEPRRGRLALRRRPGRRDRRAPRLTPSWRRSSPSSRRRLRSGCNAAGASGHVGA